MTSAHQPPTDSSPRAVDHSPSSFAPRHIGLSTTDHNTMLSALGLASVSELIEKTLPAGIMASEPLSARPALTEHEAIDRLRSLAERNDALTSLIGLGYHGTHTPAVIQRNILEKPSLVHGLHAVPARDLTGAPRGHPQLPDSDQRPHRPRDLQRVSARRVDRRRRGNGAPASTTQGDANTFVIDRTACPRPSR